MLCDCCKKPVTNSTGFFAKKYNLIEYSQFLFEFVNKEVTAREINQENAMILGIECASIHHHSAAKNNINSISNLFEEEIKFVQEQLFVSMNQNQKQKLGFSDSLKELYICVLSSNNVTFDYYLSVYQNTSDVNQKQDIFICGEKKRVEQQQDAFYSLEKFHDLFEGNVCLSNVKVSPMAAVLVDVFERLDRFSKHQIETMKLFFEYLYKKKSSVITELLVYFSIDKSSDKKLHSFKPFYELCQRKPVGVVDEFVADFHVALLKYSISLSHGKHIKLQLANLDFAFKDRLQLDKNELKLVKNVLIVFVENSKGYKEFLSFVKKFDLGLLKDENFVYKIENFLSPSTYND